MQKFIHAFNLVPGIGFLVLKRITDYFGCWQYAWEQGELGDFLNAGLSEEIAQRLCKLRPVIDVDAEMDRLFKNDIFCFTDYSDEYPPYLKETPGAPYLLYRKGAPLCPAGTRIAVVGTRLPSHYGEKCAFEIADAITENGGTVVSGLAYGIDAIAHHAAVKKGRPTVAVLASGVDKITPAGHTGLASRILESGGSIISEYACGTPSIKNRFLERNRIISGISLATVVVEANMKSGALITARHAFDQNRETFALVGDITRPQARGCHDLIQRDRAHPIVSVRGLLFDLGFNPDAAVIAGLGDPEIFILSKLKEKPLTADQISAALSLTPERTNAGLTLLEMKNLVRRNLLMEWEAC